MRSDDPLPVSAVVLAGGRSKRMGLDKALVDLDGQTLVGRVAESLGTMCAEVLVVTNHPEDLSDAGLPLGTRVIVDEQPYSGPMGALATAMAQASQEWILVSAADMPWIEPGIIDLLWSHTNGARAVVPRTEGGLEPLLALYATSIEEDARALLETGARRPADLLERIGATEIPPEMLRAVDPGLRSFVNVNTPEELAEARRSKDRSRPREIQVRTPGDEANRRSGVPVERQVTLFANGTEIATVQATPDDLDELAVGFLVLETIITGAETISRIEIDARRGLVFVQTNEELSNEGTARARYFTSGCGKGVTFASPRDTEALEPLDSTVTVTASDLARLMTEMGRAAEIHHATGGMHACALASAGELVIVREDIGRHNALDKVCGRALMDGIELDDGIFLTTGRITYEMVIKAAKASVPILVSRKSVSDLAIEIADPLGITLVGYARGGHMTVFTHPERITTSETGDGG